MTACRAKPGRHCARSLAGAAIALAAVAASPGVAMADVCMDGNVAVPLCYRQTETG